jgi:hypothetical protein
LSAGFELGVVVATPGAILDFGPALIAELLCRHAAGDWGDLDAHDRCENERALKTGARLFSSYAVGPQNKLWIITEADRSSTTILLPSEY